MVLVYVIFILVTLLSFVLILQSIGVLNDKFIFKRYEKKTRQQAVNECLKIISDERSNSVEKATSFVKLMRLDYVLVNKIVNSGENYDDNYQKEKYNNMLTESLISSIDNLEDYII